VHPVSQAIGMRQLTGTLVTLVIGLAGTPACHAFHDGGVASCNSCHTMHNLQDGQLIDPDNPHGNPDLLTHSTPSDLCLSCHAEAFGAVFGPDPLVPPPEKGAGNFVFLLEDNLNDAPDGAVNPISGDAAGHNLNAPSFGVAADGTHVTSPGGGYPSSQLGCTSCHDPHGNQNFRFLYGARVTSGEGYNFLYPAPLADGIDLLGGIETKNYHSAYRAGMSQWCGNCHHSFLQEHRGSRFEHSTSDLLEWDQVNAYNLYNGADDPFGGDPALAYLAQVPFEDSASSIQSTAGPTATSRIICLSCHRAHATSGPHSGRWDFNIDFLDTDGAVSGSYPIPNPYTTPRQGPLCAKCHGPEDPSEPITDPTR